MSLDIRSPVHGDSLADVLERILDKGIVIAGDVSVSLVGIELLTIRLRLREGEVGLLQRIEALEARLAAGPEVRA